MSRRDGSDSYHPDFHPHCVRMRCVPHYSENSDVNYAGITAWHHHRWVCFGHDFFHPSFGPIPITLDRLLLLAAIGLFAWRWLRGREDLPEFNIMDLANLV